MVDHYDRREPRQYLELNRSIHEAIVAASENEMLISIYRMLQARFLKLFIAASPKSASDWHAAVEDYERMVEALWARDASQLAIIANLHAQRQREAMGRALDLMPNERPAAIVAIS